MIQNIEDKKINNWSWSDWNSSVEHILDWSKLTYT